MTRTRTIEEIWQSLKEARTSVVHTRVDETHPLELYAEFELPDRPGLVLFCDERPPNASSMRALSIEQGRRPDGRWWLRLSLAAPELRPVFAGLCRDIVAFTRVGTNAAAAAAAVLDRIERWRALLQGELHGLSAMVLRGLIAELIVLEADVLQAVAERDAVLSWTAPLGTPQDFVLPSGHRIEVKSVQPNATVVQINGLEQLDSGGDPLTLCVVRLLDVGRDAEGAESAPRIIGRLRERLGADQTALAAFDDRLAMAGWYESPVHEEIAVRLVAIDRHDVDGTFPRLVRSNVPSGVLDARYAIALPPGGTAGGLPRDGCK